MSKKPTNPLAEFFKDLALNVELFPQAEYLQLYFAAQASAPEHMSKKKAERFMTDLAAIKRPLKLGVMADAFKKLCALSLPRKANCVCWGYSINKDLFHSWIADISVFLPGYFDGSRVHHRVSTDALALVCGNLATLVHADLRGKAYGLMPRKEEPYFKRTETRDYRAPAGFLQNIGAFAADIDVYYAPFVVIAFCAALAELVAKVDFQHVGRPFSQAVFQETMVPLGEGKLNFADVTNISFPYMQRMMAAKDPYEELCKKIGELEASSAPPSSSMPTPVASVGNNQQMLKDFVDAELAKMQLEKAEETPAFMKALAPKPEQEEEKKEEAPQMMQVDPVVPLPPGVGPAPAPRAALAGVLKTLGVNNSGEFKVIDKVTILGGDLEVTKYSYHLNDGNCKLTLSERSATLHKSKIGQGKKALYTGTVEEFDGNGGKITHVFVLCPIAAINKHFDTNFNLSGKGNIGQMNVAELGAILNHRVVEPIVKEFAAGNATVLAALAQMNNNIGQMTETFSAKLDASAQSQAPSHAVIEDDEAELAAEIARLQAKKDQLARRREEEAAREAAEKQAAAELEAAEQRKREKKRAEKKAAAELKAKQLQQLEDAALYTLEENMAIERANLKKMQQEMEAAAIKRHNEFMATLRAAALKPEQDSEEEEEEEKLEK